MEWQQILLYTLCILLSLYTIFFFYCLESLLTFRSRLKKRTKAIAVIFSEKKAILLSLFAWVETQGLNQEEAIRESAAKVRWLNLDTMKMKDIQSVAASLADLQKRLLLFANAHDLMQQDAFVRAHDGLSDLDANYRRTAAIFNSDVGGYEYWRKAPLFRLWFWIDGFRPIARLA